MSDVPLGVAAQNLPHVVQRARQADQFLTVDGDAQAVVVDARQYASMRETLRVMSDPDLMADLETGLTETSRFSASDIAQLLLRRCSSPVAGPPNAENLKRCQQLIDALDGAPAMHTAEIAPEPIAPVIPFPVPRDCPPMVRQAVTGAVAALAAAPSPWPGFVADRIPAPRTDELDTMWNLKRPEPQTDTDWAQEAHSGEISPVRRRGMPWVEKPGGEPTADRRAGLFRALLTATGLRRRLRSEQDGD